MSKKAKFNQVSKSTFKIISAMRPDILSFHLL